MFILWQRMICLIMFICDCNAIYDLAVHGDAKNGYYITVLIGTPPQEINLVLDTGSSNIAVTSVPSIFNKSSYFHCNESVTLVKLDKTVKIRYLTGEWAGFLAKDIIKFDKVVIQCTIACMLSINQIFDDASQFQGLLGLAYSSIALPDASVQTFLENLTKEQNISDMFCLDLCGPFFSSIEQTSKCGKLQVGGISEHYTDSDLVYTPIIKEWYYEVLLTDLKVGDNKSPFTCFDLNRQASFIDSGTTELYLPENVYHWVLKKIKHAVQASLPSKLWINETIACAPRNIFEIKSFPLITLSLYNTKYTTFDMVISPELYLIAMGTETKGQLCFQMAFAQSSHGTLIGSTILKGFYVVFDRQNKRIGFANTSSVNNNLDYVMRPKYAVNDIQHCKKDELSSPDIWASPFIIVVLVSSLMLAIILLYMLVTWIYKHLFIYSDDSSERSSLVEDE